MKAKLLLMYYRLKCTINLPKCKQSLWTKQKGK